VIGGYYEERRMVKIFADEYRRYQCRVGAFIPIFWRGRGPGRRDVGKTG